MADSVFPKTLTLLPMNMNPQNALLSVVVPKPIFV